MPIGLTSKRQKVRTSNVQKSQYQEETKITTYKNDMQVMKVEVEGVY